MMTPYSFTLDLSHLCQVFGERLQENVSMTRYTSARVGGKADVLISAHSADELVDAVTRLWDLNIPHIILGGGSNVLVSDAGIREVVVYNRARKVYFNPKVDPPTVWAESGASFGVIARQAANLGLAGLEWAAGIPGTIGGAVVGNAGAHGGDVASKLLVAEILHRGTSGEPQFAEHAGPKAVYKRENWPVERLGYDYRTSILKRDQGKAVVLSAELMLEHSLSERVKAQIDQFVTYRRRTQPPGASMGSMFKNPPGDYAGRLIESAGLKGKNIGRVEISPLHGNFFINHGGASAKDVWQLIQLARESIQRKFGIKLELEIELIGEW